jgi:NAD(P)-dependent dehydrogenase (short-subunit alcohol dehydrogenase family)
MSQRFANKVLLTTGGGSGLAAAVARQFTAEGGRVAVLDIDATRAVAVAAELDGAIGLAVDVASETGVRDAVADVHRKLGRIDCVFNAAGHADFGPIEEWTLERWNRMLGVHVGGTFLICKNVLPIMRAQGGGSIVNVASISALVAQPKNAPYGGETAV